MDVDFCEAITRPPSVYRGFPFLVEAAICYGGELEQEKSVKLQRFANKVPLLYQQAACATTKAISGTKWNSYGLSQSRGSLPVGPALIVVHIASVWVPFTSESKEAIAPYPEIEKEIRLALQECGRKLGSFIRKKKKAVQEEQKKEYITTFLPHIMIGLKDILDLNESKEKRIEKNLKEILEKSRK
jgi:DNA topoisomerase-6 subunit B